MGSPLIVRNTQSPGDIVVLSAAIRDLALRHPGKFDVTMTVSPGSEHVFRNNPYIKHAQKAKRPAPKGQQFVAHYPLIHKSNQAKKHFLWGFIEHMNNKLKTDIKLTDFRPDLHLSLEEKTNPVIEPPYWLFLSGGKTDFRTKIWARKYWQDVITATKDQIDWVQCGGGSKNHIMHEKIDGVAHYMVKKTGLREFIRLIYHAEGVVCAVTAAMHIAAAFNKPCVVIAGGREPWWWEAYNNENRLFNMRVGDPHWQIPADDNYVEHRFLHTQDQLSCCKGKGCWKSKLAGGSSKCQNIVQIGKQSLPKCLAMITPDKVIDSIFSYYKEGTIERGLNVVAKPPSLPSHVFCLHGPEGEWYDSMVSLIRESGDDSPIVRRDGELVKDIKEIAAGTSGHLFWFEQGAKPTSAYWLRMMTNAVAPATVCGRIYRTAGGRHYPHPGFFIAPAQQLDKEAETYTDLFRQISQDHFLPVGTDVQIPVVRPCIKQDEQ